MRVFWTSQRPLSASLLLNITRREQVGPTWWAGTWPLSADRVKMRGGQAKLHNDKRPVSSIIRQFTQNTVLVYFTLKQWHTIFRENDYPGNVFPGKWLSGKRPLTGNNSIAADGCWECNIFSKLWSNSDLQNGVSMGFKALRRCSGGGLHSECFLQCFFFKFLRWYAV